MKKTIIAIALTTVAIIAAPHKMEIIGAGSHQVPVGGAGTQLNGNTLTIVQEGMSGAHNHAIDIDLSSIAGKDGKDGIDGKMGATGTTGKDGVNGNNGSDGRDGNNGVDGTNGTNGTKGEKGDAGTTGSAGTNGIDGNDGAAGKDGKNGEDGKDGQVLNFDSYRSELAEYQNRINDLGDYTATAAAGAIAVSTIDFGTSYAGSIEVGVGFGMSGTSDYGNGNLTGYAGAAGVKYGITDEDAVIVKTWIGNHSSYGVGVGATHRF